MDGSSCSTVLLHQVFHVSPITLDLVIHLIPPLFNQDKFVQGGLRLQSQFLHSFSSHTVQSVLFYIFVFPTFPFTDYLQIPWELLQIPSPHPHRVLTKTGHLPLTPARHCSIYRGCPTPAVPWCPWFTSLETAVVWCSSSSFLLLLFTPQWNTGVSRLLSPPSPLPVNSFPCTLPQPNPQNKDPMQNFYRNALMSTIFDQLLVCVM